MWRPVFASLLVLFVLSVGPPRPSAGADEGEKVFQENCSFCHTVDRAKAKHLTRGEWQDIINRMVGFGCSISSSRKKQEEVLEYLARTQGPPAGQ